MNTKSGKISLLILSIISFLFIFEESRGEEPFWELVSMTPPRGQIEYLYSAEDGNMYLTDYFSEMFYSSDYGDNWNWLNLNYQYSGITRMNNSLFTIGYKWIDIIGNTWGIYKSIDDGKAWFEITPKWDKRRCVSLPVKDKNTIYIQVAEADSQSNYSSPSRIFDIYSSNDEGNTWDSIGHVVPPGKVSVMWNLVVSNNIIIFLAGPAKMDDYTSGYLFISKDTMKTWKEVYFKDNAFNIIIKSDSEYYACSLNGIWYTSDYGGTWAQKWLNGEPVYNVAFSPDYKDIYANVFGGKNYVCNPCGIKYSNDSGRTWQSAEEFVDMFWSKFSMQNLMIKDGYVYATPHQMGVFRSNDKGKTWVEKNNGYSGATPSDLAFIDSNIYITTSGIYKSTNRGYSFEYLGLRNTGLTSVGINSKKDIFVGDAGYGEKGIIRSTDGGKSWKDINPGLMAVNNILINSKDMIFVPFYRSIDNGDTWIEYPIGANRYGINDEDHIFAFYDGHIFRSTDDGVTWDSVGYTRVTDGTETNYGNIVFNKKTKVAGYYDLITTDNGRTWLKDTTNRRLIENDFYCALDSMYCWVAANSSGVYRSCDDGKTWYKMDTTGFKHKSFGHIGVSPDGHIHVFGSTGGLYRSRDAFVSVKEEKQPIKDELYNIPNPFSKTTEISVSLSRAADLNLIVFDIMGNKLESHNYGWQEPGETTLLFDGDKYPSGIYFYRLDLGGEAKSGVMVLGK